MAHYGNLWGPGETAFKPWSLYLGFSFVFGVFIFLIGKCLFAVANDDDIVVHPDIQKSLFFKIVVNDDDLFVYPGIQESLFSYCC